MATNYHVYASPTSGGPIDYTTPIATVSALTFSTAALAFPFDYLFGVRAFDTVSGFEDQNVDAQTRLILDAAGLDITNIPAAPSNVTARATAAGGYHVEWNYNGRGKASPTAFFVYRTVGGTVNWASSPVATVPYAPGKPTFSADLTGLSDGVTYAIGVRAWNATGTEANTTATASVTGDTTAPSDVDSLAVAMTYTS